MGLRAHGWQPVLFLFAIVWAGDSAGVLRGPAVGKRKLAPVVSPKKTWEGLFGQIAGGTLFGAAAALSYRPGQRGAPLRAFGAAARPLVVGHGRRRRSPRVHVQEKLSPSRTPAASCPATEASSTGWTRLLYASPVLLLALDLRARRPA